MKKQFKRLWTGALVGSMMLAMAIPALAGGPTPPFPTPGTTTGQSDAKVEFKAATGSNALYLENAPVLDFGQRAIKPDTMYYSAIDTTKPLEVVDIRGGGGTKWEVTAKLSDFIDSTSAVGLAGAEITFAGTNTYLGVNTAGDGNVMPNKGITGPTPGTSRPEVPAAGVTLTAGGAEKDIFTAAANLPVGRWAAHWVKDSTPTPMEGTTTLSTDVQLKVVAFTNQAEVYTAKMTWTLKNTP